MRPVEEANTFDWHGIAVSVSVSQPSWLAATRSISGITFVHLEIRADAPLPVTETGYRSHFMSEPVLAEWDSAIAYVQAWLDKDSQLPEWQEIQRQARQMTLF